MPDHSSTLTRCSHFDQFIKRQGVTRDEQAQRLGITRRQLQKLLKRPPKLRYPLEFYQALAADAASNQ